MATYVTVDNGDEALVERARQVQKANRQADLERQRDAALEARASIERATDDLQTQDPQGGAPDTSVVKRPAAQRPVTVGMFAAELTTRYDTATNTFYVKASVPGVADSVEVPTLSSGRGSVTLPPSVTDNSLFTAYGRVYKYDTGEWAIYRNGSFGGGTNYDDRFADPPRASNQTDYDYLASKRTGDQSASLLLPLSKNAGILIYIHNRVEIFNKYTRETNKVYESVNERNQRVDPVTNTVYNWGDLGYWADWDASGHTTITYTRTGQEVFSAYQPLAFFVSKRGVRAIAVPDALRAQLEDIYPAVSANGSASYTSEINFDSYYDHDFNAFVDVITTNYTTTYQNEPSFDFTAWQSASRYGTYSGNNLALPQHFGLGYLNTTSHKGPFFTPAVFQFLSGPMTVSSTNALSYSFMRSNHFPLAPRRFYAPCARQNSCQDSTVTEFDATITQPATTTTALPQSSFRRIQSTDVFVGEPEGELLYAWDWGDPTYCRQRVLALGFEEADLRP